MFKPNQKVTLVIGTTKFKRTVLEVRDGAVFLVEGGDAFHADTGKVFGARSRRYIK